MTGETGKSLRGEPRGRARRPQLGRLCPGTEEHENHKIRESRRLERTFKIFQSRSRRGRWEAKVASAGNSCAKGDLRRAGWVLVGCAKWEREKK